jgi:hypothetical protein
LATLLHAAENATTALVPVGLLVIPNDLFFQAKIYGLLAVILIAMTRGKLAYEPNRLASGKSVAAVSVILTPRKRLARIVLAVLVFVVLGGAIINVLYVAINSPQP